MPFYDEVTHPTWVDGGKVMRVIFLGFSKAFGTVPHSILSDKLSDMSGFTVHCVKNWLKDRAPSVVVKGATPGW